eukprot:CAMPEP_0173191636 /NCGR_PEP_ID=MMETSP1141-20130122/12994_1 /TAXON_ID=483371 /ORGANISM="non described non described, Strain CCMP2298" /LENGTH=64 /DNA_ID=CAMNT_0014115845 /DNA_START=615 /DNA_END=809 /DNA_ORIENTATION=-
MCASSTTNTSASPACTAHATTPTPHISCLALSALSTNSTVAHRANTFKTANPAQQATAPPNDIE